MATSLVFNPEPCLEDTQTNGQRREKRAAHAGLARSQVSAGASCLWKRRALHPSQELPRVLGHSWGLRGQRVH